MIKRGLRLGRCDISRRVGAPGLQEGVPQTPTAIAVSKRLISRVKGIVHERNGIQGVNGSPWTRTKDSCPVKSKHRLYRGRRNGAGHLGCDKAGIRGGCSESIFREKKDSLVRTSWRRKGRQRIRRPVAAGDHRADQEERSRHKGPSHHPGRDRHQEPKRGAQADPRSLRLHSPGEIFPRSAVTGLPPRKSQHDHLQGEHGGRLRRDRMGIRI